MERFLKELAEKHSALCVKTGTTLTVRIPTEEFKELGLGDMLDLAKKYGLIKTGEGREELIKSLKAADFEPNGGSSVLSIYQKSV